MASNALVKRQRQPTLMTKEIKKRNKLSMGETLRAFPPTYLALTSLWIGIPGIPTWIFLMWLPGMIATSIASIMLITATVWGMASADGNDACPSQSLRKKQILYERSRLGRPHANLEKTRLRELDRLYPRYSLWIKAEKKAILLEALVHQPVKFSMGIPFTASTTKDLYNVQSGNWDDEPIYVARISNPTVDKVQDAVTTAQMVIEKLEEEAYQEALEEHQLELVALTLQPPPASTEAQAKLIMNEHELENLLGKSDSE